MNPTVEDAVKAVDLTGDPDLDDQKTYPILSPGLWFYTNRRSSPTRAVLHSG